MLAIVASLAGIAQAQTTAPATQPTLAASIGFDGVFKPDNWSPVYVTLADEARRAGTLEVRAAHGRLGHDVVARVVANPSAQTFTLYAPLGALDRAQVQFRDAAGKVVASRDLSDDVQKTPAAFGGFAVGVSGDVASARRVVGDLVRDTGEYVSSGYVAPRLLPERAIGYRAVDAVVIAGLDTDAMDDRVEQAIVDWVRAGGVLVAWPGAQRTTQADAPLAALLPADEGELRNLRVGDRDLIARTLAPREGAADLSAGGVTTYRRRVGLGQIVYTNVDPTSLAVARLDDRLAQWRRLFEDQFSLLPGDRRSGVFDPLVAQSLAEQSVRAAAPASHTDWRPWLWAALLVGLVMGPGEIVMLGVAGRHPRTPYTLAGLGLIVASGIALAVVREPRSGDARASVLVTATDGNAAEATVALGAAEGPVSWLAGDASDPTRQPAGLAVLAQREERFDARVVWSAPGDTRPLTRGLRFASDFDAAATQPTTAGTPTIVRPTEVVRPDGTTVAADDPATTRRETGIERLAADPAWSAIFLDRTLAARLVRLQESEKVTILATRSGDGAAARILLRVER